MEDSSRNGFVPAVCFLDKLSSNEPAAYGVGTTGKIRADGCSAS